MDDRTAKTGIKVADVRGMCEVAETSLDDAERERLFDALATREEHEAVTILDDQSGWIEDEHITCILSEVRCIDGTQRVAMCWGAEGPELLAVDDDVRTCADLIPLVSDEDREAQEGGDEQ